MTIDTFALSPRDHLARLNVQDTVDYIEAHHIFRNIPGEGLSSDSEPALPRPHHDPYPILIIGAGAAGLCAAMMLQDLGIDYEIVEAEADEELGGHVGGRIYTHRFNGKAGIDAPFNDPKRYDYIDMGAMRFPDIPSQAPTFRLFQRVFPRDEYDKFVIKYIMTSDGQLDNYNRTTCLSSEVNKALDIFKVAAPTKSEPATKGFVPKEYLQYVDDQGPHYVNDGGHWTNEALGPLVKIAREATTPEKFREAWKILTQHEAFSTRSYLATKTTEYPPKASEYPQSVIEWLEMMNTGTGLYNHALIESVFDAVEFGDPQVTTSAGLKASANTEQTKKDWYCLDGGSDRLIRAMTDTLKKKPIYGTRVVTIKNAQVSFPAGVKAMEIKAVGQGGKPPGQHSPFYSQVISTVPLGCLASVDMEDCKLSFTQETAIRSLAYDSSTKVALRFEKRWWETLTTPIVGGVTSTDRPARIVVYPSYGLNCPPGTPPPGVMIGSYTWAQDARMGSIAEDESVIVDLVLNNIADIHGIPRDRMYEVMGPRSSIQSKVLAWSNEPHARGAFACFGPGQYGSPSKNGFSMFASLKAPANDGRLHFAGEATSVHHAWVVGALNSAWRSVYNALWDPELRKKLIEKWPVPNEEDIEPLKKLAGYGFFGAV